MLLIRRCWFPPFVLLQTIGYGIFEDSVLVTRNLALTGALLLLVAESQVENRSLFAGLPSLGENTQKQYLQLGGRILLVLMFITLFRFEASLLQMLIIAGGLGLVLLVAIGYKTKLCALVLVFLLTLFNFYYNAFWNIPSHQVSRDFAKYDFFQTFSVIGGLLLVVAIGPGGVSLDEHKKKWWNSFPFDSVRFALCRTSVELSAPCSFSVPLQLCLSVEQEFAFLWRHDVDKWLVFSFFLKDY